jgi:hypothetical protein
MPLLPGQVSMHSSLSPAARLASELRLLDVLSAVQAGTLAVYLDSASALRAPRCAMEKTYKVIKPVYNSVFYNCIRYSFASDAKILRRCAPIAIVVAVRPPPSPVNTVITVPSFCDVVLVPKTFAATAANDLSLVSL